MDNQPLIDAGLSDAQSNAYIALMGCSPATPPHLAEVINESRSNTYKVLEQLEELGLARKEDIAKKMHYWALNPSALLDVIDSEFSEIDLRRRNLEVNMPSLQESYLKHNRQPGIRQFQGKRGLAKILDLQITDGEKIHYIRSSNDHQKNNYSTVNHYRHEARKQGLHRYGITQDISEGPKNHVESDKFMKLTRTWINPEDYDSPVEWAVFGDKISILSYGVESVGMVIDNKEIARSFKQLWDMMDRGIRNEPDYDKRPTRVKKTAATADEIDPIIS